MLPRMLIPRSEALIRWPGSGRSRAPAAGSLESHAVTAQHGVKVVPVCPVLRASQERGRARFALQKLNPGVVSAPNRVLSVDRRALLTIDPLRDATRRLEVLPDLRDQREVAFAQLRAPFGVPVNLQPHLALAPFRGARQLRIIQPPVDGPTAQRPGEVQLAGDRRSQSWDGRYFGPTSRVLGRAVWFIAFGGLGAWGAAGRSSFVGPWLAWWIILKLRTSPRCASAC
jgi:hypothetical protein